jgi:membrane protein required for colicin V production
MNWADWAILAILGVSVAISLMRGFVREAMSLAVWLAAFIVAMVFHQQLGLWLTDLIEAPSLRLMAAWLILFVAVLLVGGLVNYLLGQLVDATGLSGTDRLLGMIFGGVRGVVVVTVLLIVLPGILPVEQDRWWNESLLIPWFQRFEDEVRQMGVVLADFFQSLF